MSVLDSAGRRPRAAGARTWLIVAGCCALTGWLGLVFCRQYAQFFVIRAENERINRQILAMKATQQHLRREQAILATDAGMEREARRLGYLKQGEARLSVPE
jgi:hypothetical protein